MIATVIIIIDNRILPILISLVYEIGNFFYLLALETGGQLFVYTIDFIALVNLRKYINLYQKKLKTGVVGWFVILGHREYGSLKKSDWQRF